MSTEGDVYSRSREQEAGEVKVTANKDGSVNVTTR
jgi:hypothetical protein